MNDYDYVIIFVGFASYLGAIVQGITTFGDAIVIHLLVAHRRSAGPARHELNTIRREPPCWPRRLTLSVRSMAVSAAFSWQSRQFVSWPLIKVLAPIQIFMVLLGAYVLDRYHASPLLGPILGSLYCIAAMVFAWGAIRSIIDEHKSQQAVAAVIPSPQRGGGNANDEMEVRAASSRERSPNGDSVVAVVPPEFHVTRKLQACLGSASFLGGFMNGIVGVGGPPVMIVALWMKVPPTTLRGFIPQTGFLSFVVRDAMTLAAGRYELGAWEMYAAAVMGAVAGLYVGIELGGRLAKDVYVILVCWLLLFAAVAIAQLSAWFVIAAFAACGLSFAALAWFKMRQRTTRGSTNT